MKCANHQCHSEATHRIFWPENRSAPSCEGYKDFALRVAWSMGKHLIVQPLDPPEPRKDPDPC